MALIVACSFCMQSAILSALIPSPYSRGSTTEVTATAAKTKTRTGMALAVPATPTSGASESATAATATTSDDCCEVCIVAPRAGFALVPCGCRTRCDLFNLVPRCPVSRCQSPHFDGLAMSGLAFSVAPK